MINTFQFFLFVLFSIYAFIHSLSYAIYEIKDKGNKFGGIYIVLISLLASIFAVYSIIRS